MAKSELGLIVISSIRFGYIKSFSVPQNVLLSIPDGKLGSGYNVIVGANNSGKSTLVTAVRNLLSQGESVTIGQEARHSGESPIADVLWEDSEGTERIAINPNLDGAIFQKSGNRQRIQKKFRFVPSRRPFGSEYNTHGIMTAVDYEQNEFVNRLSNQSYFDGQLATSIASFFAFPQNKNCVS